MSNQKVTGEFFKVRKLISVLEKCNGKSKIGGSEALISPRAAKILAAVGLVFLIAALAAAAYFTEPLISPYISLQDFTKVLMMILLMLSLVLSVKNIVTVLYTADDLPVLLPMPFSANQIVIAKLSVTLQFPVVLSVILINASFFGFGLRAGMGAAFYIGTVLSSFLIPVTGLAVAALLTVVIFKCCGFIRNRDIMVAIGGILTIVLTVGYLIVSSILSSKDSPDAALSAFSVAAGLSDNFPNIAFMSGFMFDGSITGLFISLGITAAAIALALLVIKLFYLSTALSMQNTGFARKPVEESMLSARKKRSALKALTSYEAKNARRNPSYMIYGFAMTFIWPLFFILPFAFGKNAIFSSATGSVDTSAALICALLLGVAASCFACGFNILPGTAFSREGDSFYILRAMPLDFKDYYKSKLLFSMLICSLGSVSYILILGIVCILTGIVPFTGSWVFLYSVFVCVLCNLIFVNSMLVNNAGNPVFTRDSETEISRKLGGINAVALIIGFVMYIALFVLIIIAMIPELSSVFLNSTTGTVAAVTAAVFALAVLVIAAAVNKTSVKKAEKSLMIIE
ncbi:MAG: hypothetical protein IJJ15_09060 [Ruminococcus sp.]|nr:hypothetical protein [Ruminococcus sp.]